MDPALRLQPGKPELMPEQEAEARRFAEAYIQAQLATSPVDELEAEALLRHAYEMAGLAPPARIQWLDGPLQLVDLVGSERRWRVEAMSHVRDRVRKRLMDSVRGSVWASIRDRIEERVEHRVWANVGASVEASLDDSLGERGVEISLFPSVGASVEDGVRAYLNAPWLAVSRFFDRSLTPTDASALARFTPLVSGYGLGQERALLVRRPRVLCCDAEGALHHETGKCLAYHDGWGISAWHGVRVPEQVILAPERLTREDFLDEEHVEVRRVIQERMGSRFAPELGGVVIDTGERGTLYEARLREDDPEGVARYVQVQDATTLRHYFLRVPPTIQTSAEAIAWSFTVSVEEYRPAQET